MTSITTPRATSATEVTRTPCRPKLDGVPLGRGVGEVGAEAGGALGVLDRGFRVGDAGGGDAVADSDPVVLSGAVVVDVPEQATVPLSNADARTTTVIDRLLINPHPDVVVERPSRTWAGRYTDRPGSGGDPRRERPCSPG